MILISGSTIEVNQKEFISIVWDHYNNNKRDFVWRSEPTPYNVMLSELMLQQTQTARVVSKFNEFKTKFPTVTDLANAEWPLILKMWVGLGYNRRAQNLHKCAQAIRDQYNGTIPSTKEELMALPGIGPYTSSAIRAFAFNEADPFIETNIRTVYLHHFYPNQGDVTDKDLMFLIEETMDRGNPREWYWALMDYGVYLKATFGNANKRSRHYTKQSKFEGSTRQLRSQILKSVLGNQSVSKEELEDAFKYDSRAHKQIDALVKEGMIKYTGTHYTV